MRKRAVPARSLVRSEPPCAWCLDEGTVRTTYGEKLCGSCRNIAVQQRTREREGDSFSVAVYREMETMARAFGERYRSDVESAGGLELEYALANVSRFICRKNLFHGLASYLDHDFNREQRRALIRLLYRMIRKSVSRGCHVKAAYSPNLNWTPPGLRRKMAANPRSE